MNRLQILDYRFQKIVRFSILLASSVYLLTSVSHVRAEDVSLVISPPRYDIEAKPGETIQKNIKVTNNSQTKELILRAYAIDFIVMDDLGTPVKVDTNASGKYLASPWFTLVQNELVIPAKGTETLNVSITVPYNALPGGHYAGVFFEPIQGRGQKTTVSYTNTQVGSLFGITIPGDIKYDALIKTFTTKNLSEFGPIDFKAVIENQSDTHIRPQAKIIIRDMIGRKLEELNLDEVNIFPYTSRTLAGTWDTVWGLGRYTATISVAYGPGLVAERSIFFWILPYRLLAALGVILLVILVLYIVVRRHLKHREDDRDEQIDQLRRKIVEMENRNHH